MSNSISNTSHANSVKETAPASAPQPAKRNSAQQTAKATPLPQDKVSLSSKAQTASAARNTTEASHESNTH